MGGVNRYFRYFPPHYVQNFFPASGTKEQTVSFGRMPPQSRLKIALLLLGAPGAHGPAIPVNAISYACRL
jgi:hypothetical protein